jgi:hypothetical protein
MSRFKNLPLSGRLTIARMIRTLIRYGFKATALAVSKEMLRSNMEAVNALSILGRNPCCKHNPGKMNIDLLLHWLECQDDDEWWAAAHYFAGKAGVYEEFQTEVENCYDIFAAYMASDESLAKPDGIRAIFRPIDSSFIDRAEQYVDDYYDDDDSYYSEDDVR